MIKTIKDFPNIETEEEQIEAEEGEPAPPEDNSQQELYPTGEYKQFFSFESGEGIKLSCGSSTQPTEVLADLIMNFYLEIKKQNGADKKSSYIG